MSVLHADAQRLHSALGALPHDQRQAIELAFFSGLTHKEIATRTGAPLGTVKGRVRLGQRRLRDTLDGSGVALSGPTRQRIVAEPVQPTRQ
jgi:RNA polymerase sigma-70 factor (ECF subfamily)